MKEKYIYWALIIGGVILEVIGDIFFKKWAILNKNYILILGFLIYFSGAVLWAFTLRYEGLSKAVSVFTLLNLIILVLVGVLFFNEKLTLLNKLGILLALISVILIES